MPYITKKRAEEIDSIPGDSLLRFVGEQIRSSGEFNFVLSSLAAERIKDLGVNYENLKSVYGDMLLAAEEFRERLIVPYETIKMQDDDNVDPYFDVFLQVTKK